jgi:hypothetical protein
MDFFQETSRRNKGQQGTAFNRHDNCRTILLQQNGWTYKSLFSRVLQNTIFLFIQGKSVRDILSLWHDHRTWHALSNGLDCGLQGQLNDLGWWCHRHNENISKEATSTQWAINSIRNDTRSCQRQSHHNGRMSLKQHSTVKIRAVKHLTNCSRTETAHAFTTQWARRNLAQVPQALQWWTRQVQRWEDTSLPWSYNAVSGVMCICCARKTQTHPQTGTQLPRSRRCSRTRHLIRMDCRNFHHTQERRMCPLGVRFLRS